MQIICFEMRELSDEGKNSMKLSRNVGKSKCSTLRMEDFDMEVKRHLIQGLNLLN